MAKELDLVLYQGPTDITTARSTREHMPIDTRSAKCVLISCNFLALAMIWCTIK